jgi:hypothetical protein
MSAGTTCQSIFSLPYLLGLIDETQMVVCNDVTAWTKGPSCWWCSSYDIGWRPWWNLWNSPVGFVLGCHWDHYPLQEELLTVAVSSSNFRVQILCLHNNLMISHIHLTKQLQWLPIWCYDFPYHRLLILAYSNKYRSLPRGWA